MLLQLIKNCILFALLLRLIDMDIFDDVSRIVTRGCHDQATCGNPISNSERRFKFEKVISVFGKAQMGTSHEGQTSSPTGKPFNPPTFSPTENPITAPTPHPTLRTNLNPSTAVSRVTHAPATVTPVQFKKTSSPTFNMTLAPSRVTIAPAKVETMPPTSEGEFSLSTEELEHRLKFANNYCASSLEDAKARCATTLRTCNTGEMPCAIGTACFEHVVCYIPESIDDSESSALAQSGASSTSSLSPAATVVLNTVSCKEICLRPLSETECVVGGDELTSLPDCLSVAIGEMCENRGECGTFK